MVIYCVRMQVYSIAAMTGSLIAGLRSVDVERSGTCTAYIGWLDARARWARNNTPQKGHSNSLLYALSKAGIAVVCKRGEGLLRTSKRQAFVSAVRWWEERAAV